MSTFPTIPPGMGWPFVDAATGEFQSTAVKEWLSGRYGPSQIAPVGYGLRRAGTTVCIGDSLTEYLYDRSTNVVGQNWTQILANISHGRFLLTRNSGVSGDTVLDIAARINSDVIAYAPSRCIVLAGTNSTTKGAAHLALAMTAYENDIIKRLLSAGIEPVLCTIPPRDGTRTAGYPGSSPEMNVEVYRFTLRWNLFVRHMASKYRLRLLDVYTYVTSPVTGEYAPDYTDDGTHFSASGNYRVASMMWADIGDLYPAVAVPVPVDHYDHMSGATDPLFFDAFTAGTGGVFPQGFDGNGTLSDLTVTNPAKDAPLVSGEWCKLTKAASPNTVSALSTRTLSSWSTKADVTIAPGDRVGLGFRYRISARAGSGFVSAAWVFLGSGGSGDPKGVVTPMSRWMPRTDGSQPTTGYCYIESVIPAGTVYVRLMVSLGANTPADATAAITVELGELCWVDLDATDAGSVLRPGV